MRYEACPEIIKYLPSCQYRTCPVFSSLSLRFIFRFLFVLAGCVLSAPLRSTLTDRPARAPEARCHAARMGELPRRPYTAPPAPRTAWPPPAHQAHQPQSAAPAPIRAPARRSLSPTTRSTSTRSRTATLQPDRTGDPASREALRRASRGVGGGQRVLPREEQVTRVGEAGEEPGDPAADARLHEQTAGP